MRGEKAREGPKRFPAANPLQTARREACRVATAKI
jgi:hypothetical protein